MASSWWKHLGEELWRVTRPAQWSQQKNNDCSLSKNETNTFSRNTKFILWLEKKCFSNPVSKTTSGLTTLSYPQLHPDSFDIRHQAPCKAKYIYLLVLYSSYDKWNKCLLVSYHILSIYILVSCAVPHCSSITHYPSLFSISSSILKMRDNLHYGTGDYPTIINCLCM